MIKVDKGAKACVKDGRVWDCVPSLDLVALQHREGSNDDGASSLGRRNLDVEQGSASHSV